MASSVHIKYEWFLYRSTWFINGTLTSITSLAQSRFENNSNENVLNIFQISRTEASPSIMSHTLDHPFLEVGLNPLQEIWCIVNPAKSLIKRHAKKGVYSLAEFFSAEITIKNENIIIQ